MAINYGKAPWEDLDVWTAEAQHRNYGVFDAESVANRPLVICRSEDECVSWINWQRSRGDDCVFGNMEITICPIDKLTGKVWNSHDKPPRRDTEDPSDRAAQFIFDGD